MCFLFYDVCVMFWFFFFFFKQKTAYEMRISDWSSDVCSSDLAKADIVAQRQLLIGIIAARQPVDHAAECRSLQTQFLREGLELPESAGIAVEQDRKSVV